jgi:L-asparaginase II
MATAAHTAGRGSGIGLAQQFLALAAEALLFELQLLLLTRLRYLRQDLLQLQVALHLFVVLLALALRLLELAPFDFLALCRRQRGIEAFLKLALAQQQLVLVLLALQQLPLHAARGRLREPKLGAQTGAGQAASHGAGAPGTSGYHGAILCLALRTMAEANIPLPSHAPLVIALRGDAVENVYYGSVAVCNTKGELLLAAGDCGFPVFTRSTLKPFQALPFILDEGHIRLGFGPPDIALMCGSHSGEERHVAAVTAMLSRAGAAPAQLQCGCHLPLLYAACGLTPPTDFVPNALHHNCSGKHAGFLAYCRIHGLPFVTYLAPDHPLQRRIPSLLAAVAGCPEDALRRGTDGCGAPNYALPLRALATAYARLANERGGEFGTAFATVFDAMTGAPEMVSGLCRGDALLMQSAPGELVAKAGAEGMQALGMRGAGLGVALKISDGDPAALRAATATVLEQLDRLPPDPSHALRRWTNVDLRNHAGKLTGRVQAVFRLRRPMT